MLGHYHGKRSAQSTLFRLYESAFRQSTYQGGFPSYVYLQPYFLGARLSRGSVSVNQMSSLFIVLRVRSSTGSGVGGESKRNFSFRTLTCRLVKITLEVYILNIQIAKAVNIHESPLTVDIRELSFRARLDVFNGP